MDIATGDFGGAPVVLAFAADWTLGAESHEELETIRAELRGLGATLVVLSKNGIWSFRPDDVFERFVARDDEVALQIARLARRYGVRRDAKGASAPTVLVLDGEGGARFLHVAASGALRPPIAQALAEAGRTLSRSPRDAVLVSRREWVLASLIAGFALVFFDACFRREAPRPTPSVEDATAPDENESDVVLRVNGTDHTVRIDPRVSLLDALRERLGLVGTKKGCDHGQCGACTVLVDDRRVCSCLTLAVMVQGKAITTIEGLARGDDLHPMQAAFVSNDALQCGYCTPGQIMSAVGLVSEGHAHTDDEVREEMSGNLCRCGAYPNIVAALRLVRRGA